MATLQLKPKTIAGYRGLLRALVLPAFGKVPLGGIEPESVQQWVTGLSERLSPSRVRQAYHLLGASLADAVRSGYLSRSPCVGVRLPRVARRDMRFLSGEEVARLAEAAGEYGNLIYVLAYGGLRWGEAAALRRRRCDLLRSRLHVAESLADVNGELVFGPTKTHQDRVVRLPGFLRELLADHLSRAVPADPGALVFTSPQGTPLRLSNWRRRVWEPAVAAAGLPAGLRVHDLRHTAAALLIQQGAHPKVIQMHLGHASITTTLDRYGHLFDDDLDRLADALDAAHRDSLTAYRRPGTGPPSVRSITAGAESGN